MPPTPGVRALPLAGETSRDSETRAQLAYRRIEQMIVSLELQPGSKISEQTLSAALGLGRTPVREALQRLAREGTVEVRPRSGVVVSRIDVGDHFKLIEVRREVERILVRRCARLADGAVRRAFGELRDRFVAARDTGDAALFMAADREFNALVARTADNAYAARTMAPLQAQTRRFWFLYFERYGDLARVSGLHAAIAAAIAANDPDEAVATLEALLDYVEEYTELTRRALASEATKRVPVSPRRAAER